MANGLNTQQLLLVGAIGLAGVGVLMLTRRGPMEKSPGEPIAADITFQHQGPGLNIWAGWGYADSQAVGQGPLTGWAYNTITLADDPDWSNYAVTVEAVIPGLATGKYDLLLFLQQENGSLNADGSGFLANKWFRDLLTVV